MNALSKDREEILRLQSALADERKQVESLCSELNEKAGILRILKASNSITDNDVSNARRLYNRTGS